MNLEDVARKAGVSRSTVSRVVNDDRRVSEEARRRVREVIRESRYQPHAAARSLASRRTRIIGLLIPRAVGNIFGDPYFPQMIEGAVGACNDADYNLMMLMDTAGEPEGEKRAYSRIIRGRHLDGVVISSSVIDDPVVSWLREDRFPFVLVGRHPGRLETSYVDVDNQGAAHGAVTHLLKHGYERIAVIGGPTNMIPAIDRYGGYVSAMLTAGLVPDPNLTRHADFTNAGGYRAMKSLLPQLPEAVFAASDFMAFGALRALREAGLRVPEDVAVIGFDGLEEDATSQPPLSSVYQDFRAMGREAVRTLLRRIEAPGEKSIQRLLETRTVIRRSCGCSELTDSVEGEDERLGTVESV